MALSPQKLGQILGLQVQGDLGPMTCYTQKHKHRRSIVLFPKIWLSDPTTIEQTQHRNRIRAAAREWWTLAASERANWIAAAKRLSLRTNGYALWTFWHMLQLRQPIETIERQTGITLITGLH